MGSSNTRSSPIGFPYRERPRLLHLLIGITVSAFTNALLWLHVRQLLVDGVSQLLSIGQISLTRSISSEAPQLVVTLSDGSNFDLVFTWQRSGILSVTIFSLMFLFLMFPLKGSIWPKLVWLELGFIVGLTWSLIRLSTVALVAYHFGTGAFSIAEFLMGPFTDFMWMISLWSVGLSTLVSTKGNR